MLWIEVQPTARSSRSAYTIDKNADWLVSPGLPTRSVRTERFCVLLLC